MKNILIALIVLLSFNTFSQTQFGITAELNSAQLKTIDLYGVENGKIGYGFGISTLSALWQTADLVIEGTYNVKKINAKGFFDYYDQSTDFNSGEFSISDINLNFLLNQYIIMPDRNNLNLAIQGGFGVSMLNEWSENKEIIFDGSSKFKVLYYIGVSSGIEQVRVTLKYAGAISNVFNEYFVHETPDSNNYYDNEREYNGKLGNISLSVTYYFDLFGN